MATENNHIELLPNDLVGIKEENRPMTYEVTNIQAISDNILEALACGDEIIKITGNQKHSYRVSYKEEHVGICLTYVDASVSETVSYDYTGGTWVYNSTDITQLGQSGTKLYLHCVNFTDSMEQNYTIAFYSVSATPIIPAESNLLAFMSAFVDNFISMINPVFKDFSGNNIFEIIGGYIDTDNGYIVFNMIYEGALDEYKLSADSVASSTFTDVVEEI